MAWLAWVWLTASAAPVEPISADQFKALLESPGARPRVVNLWATWCGPCVAELPLLAEFQRQRPDVEVVLVNVELPAVRESRVGPFLDSKKISGVRSTQLDVQEPTTALPTLVTGWTDALPLTRIVGTDGRQLAQFTQAVTAAQLEAALGAPR